MINVSHLCRLGLYREAEKQFRSALNHQEVVDTYLYLAKVVTSHYQLAAQWKILFLWCVQMRADKFKKKRVCVFP